MLEWEPKASAIMPSRLSLESISTFHQEENFFLRVVFPNNPKDALRGSGEEKS